MYSKASPWILSLTLLFSTVVHSAAELIPFFQTNQEKQAYVDHIRTVIPFATTNTVAFLDFQIQALSELRRQFPDYDKWMQDKPSPLTIEIFEQTVTREQTPLLDKKILEEIHQKTQSIYDKEISQIPQKNTPQELWDRGLQMLVVGLQKPDLAASASTRGLMVGLAQVLAPENKAHFFKLADPQLQLQYFESLNISDQALRESSFKASTLGLKQEAVTVKEILEAARDRIGEGTETFLHLSYLKALLNMKLGNPNLQFSNYLAPADFEFSLQIKDFFLDQLLDDVAAKQLMTREILLQRLQQFQATVQRKWFTYEVAEKKHLVPFAKVIEVNPQFAVHRGCIGGDCSTTFSPLFPYSPWEHVFYVQNARGQFVGYISGARLQTGDKTAFYMRDIQGPNLSPAIAEAILHAFPQALKHFGVDQFLLMYSGFIKQNNSSSLRALLQKYQLQAAAVPLVFTDEKVRSFIYSTASFRSTSSYDGMHAHPQGTPFVLNAQIQNRFHYRMNSVLQPKNPTININPEERGRAFFEALRWLHEKKQIKAIGGFTFSEQELVTGLNVLLNKDNGLTNNYVTSIQNLLKENGLAWSLASRDEIRSLFKIGLLNAPNAFTDPSYSNLAKHFFFQMIEQHSNYSLVFEIASRETETLRHSPQFFEQLAEMGRRLDPHDVFQLAMFKSLGHRAAGVYLSSKSEKARERIEEAVLLPSYPDFSTTVSSAATFKLINQMEQKIHGVARLLQSSEKRSIAEIDSALSEALSVYGLEQGQLKNKLLVSRIRDLYLKAKDLDSHFRRFAPMMMEGVKSRTFDVFRVYKLIAESGRRDEFTDAFFRDRLERIQRSYYEQNEKVEFFLMVQMGFAPAIERLKEFSYRQSYISCLSFALEKVKDGDLHPLNKLFTPFRNSNFLIPERVSHIIDSPPQGFTLTWLFQEIDRLAKQLHLSRADFLSIHHVEQRLHQNWLYASDAFSNPNSEIVNRTLKYMTGRISYPLEVDSDFTFAKVRPHLKYLSQKSEFQNMIKVAYDSLFAGINRDFNAQILMNSIEQGLIPDYLTNNEKGLRALSLSKNRNYQVVALQNARKLQVSVPIQDYTLQFLLLPPKPVLKPLLDKAMDKFKEFRDEIRYFFARGEQKTENLIMLITKTKYLEINADAMKEAHRFIRHGGNPKQAITDLTSQYDRAELAENTAATKDLALYRKLAKKAGGMPGSCGILFSKLNSRPLY